MPRSKDLTLIPSLMQFAFQNGIVVRFSGSFCEYFLDQNSNPIFPTYSDELFDTLTLPSLIPIKVNTNMMPVRHPKQQRQKSKQQQQQQQQVHHPQDANVSRKQKNRCTSSSSRRRRQDTAPIQMISFVPLLDSTSKKDEQRDEQQHHNDDEDTNMLVDFIQKRNWDMVLLRIESLEGMKEATQMQPKSKDYALHILCQCGNYNSSHTYNPRMKKMTKMTRQQQRHTPLFSGESHASSSDNSESHRPPSADEEEEDDDDESNSSRSHSISNSLNGNSDSTSQSKESLYFPNYKEEKVDGENVLDSRKLLPPPLLVLEAVWKAYPDAIKHAGSYRATALHWAVRNEYPVDLLTILIRHYPAALDMRDMANNTPRCYVDGIVDHPLSKSVLLRPTSCWLQHLRDERVYDEAEDDITEMEANIDRLCCALTESLQEEDVLECEIVKLETELSSFDNRVHAKAFVDRITQIQEKTERSMMSIREKCDELERQVSHMYAEEEKERAFLTSFNLDVERIYASANVSLEDMRAELEGIIRKSHLPINP